MSNSFETGAEQFRNGHKRKSTRCEMGTETVLFWLHGGGIKKRIMSQGTKSTGTCKLEVNHG